MTALTVSGMPRDGSPQEVFRVADRFQMIRIHTGAIAASVIKNQPLRNRTHEVLVDQAMTSLVEPLPVTAASRNAISVFIGAAGPNPASLRLLDLTPEVMGTPASLGAKTGGGCLGQKRVAAIKAVLSNRIARHGHLLGDFLVDWAGKSVRKTEVQSG